MHAVFALEGGSERVVSDSVVYTIYVTKRLEAGAGGAEGEKGSARIYRLSL
jgi:hypothetical protein